MFLETIRDDAEDSVLLCERAVEKKKQETDN